jgi:hypothetical protein
MVRLTFSGNKITSDVNIDTNYHERTLQTETQFTIEKIKAIIKFVNSFVALIKGERYHETSISENLLVIKKEHLVNYPIA